MSQHTFGRPALAIAILLLLTAVPETADAQFGRLKKLKNAVNPDSATKAEAAKADSIAIAAKLAVGDTTPIPRSRFSRAVTASRAGAEKFEQVTGVSAKDAALAASGVGATGLVAKKLGVDPKAILAKKLGVDPTSIGTNAIEKALEQRSLSKAGIKASIMEGALNKVGGAGLQSKAGIKASIMEGALNKVGGAGMQSKLGNVAAGAGMVQGLPDMAELVKMQQAAMKNAAKQSGAGLKGQSVMGFSEADVRALAVFQQEMMQVAMAAAGGNAAAQARLNRWEGIALKYQPEMERISRSAGPGDLKALQRLQEIQFLMLKEWAATR